jgi:CBS domain containing-hemolysin-like protein
MQRAGSHLARVVGEDGVTAGLIFLEDVLEQLVGEVVDASSEREPAEEETAIHDTPEALALHPRFAFIVP